VTVCACPWHALAWFKCCIFVKLLSCFGKRKGKGHPKQATKAQKWGWMYSCTLSLTSALDGVGGQHHAAAALPPGKTRYQLLRRLGGPRARSGRVRKISPATGIRSPDRPARSESLYRLSYPDPPCFYMYGNSMYWIYERTD
jgi:hypothetical protein